MRKLSVIATAVVATAFTSAIAVAQTRTPPVRPNRAAPPAAAAAPAPGAQMQQRAQMARRMGAGPAANLLRAAAQLELTDDQVKRLETLQSAASARINEADMLRAQADLMDARKGDVNLDKARAAFDKMARLKTDQQVAQLKAQQDARNVLTVAQKAKVDAVASSMRDRRNTQMRGRDGARGGRGQGINGRRGGIRGGQMGGGIGNDPRGQMMAPRMQMRMRMQMQGRGGAPMPPTRVRPPEDSIPN